jgi:hypothetical protein
MRYARYVYNVCDAVARASAVQYCSIHKTVMYLYSLNHTLGTVLAMHTVHAIVHCTYCAHYVCYVRCARYVHCARNTYAMCAMHFVFAPQYVLHSFRWLLYIIVYAVSFAM